MTNEERKVIEEIQELADAIYMTTDGASCANALAILDKCNEILSVPMRNCDRFDNYSDARSEFDGNLGAPEWRFGAWLFAKEDAE